MKHARSADAHLRRFDHWHTPTLAAAIVVGTCGLIGAVAHQAADIAPVVKAEDVTDLEQPGVTGQRRVEPALTTAPTAPDAPPAVTSAPLTAEPPAPLVPVGPERASVTSQTELPQPTGAPVAQDPPPAIGNVGASPATTVEPAPEPTAAATTAAPPATPTVTEEQSMPTRRIPPGHAKRTPR